MTRGVFAPLRLFGKLAMPIAVLALASGADLKANASDMPTKTSRIVAVGGSITEIVYALGQEDRLAGRDATSTFPETAEELPDVGYMRALAPEGVLSLSPDMILMLEGSGPPPVLEVLGGAGINMIEIPESFTADGVLTKVTEVGKALEVPEQAARLRKELKAEFDQVAVSVNAGDEPRAKALFILSLNGGNVVAAGADTAAAGMMELAGLENAVVGFAGYKPLSPEAMLAAEPDVILMMDRTGDHQVSLEQLKDVAGLASTPAVRNGHVIGMDGMYMLGFGPRTARAAREISDKVSAFAAVRPSSGSTKPSKSR